MKPLRRGRDGASDASGGVDFTMEWARGSCVVCRRCFRRRGEYSVRSPVTDRATCSTPKAGETVDRQRNNQAFEM